MGVTDRILDIGSGPDKPYGDLFQGSSHIGIDLYDPSDILGDISSLPIKSEVADLVLCTEVLEHIAEPSIVLHEARRVLKAGQYLIITVPLIWGEHDHVDYQRWTETGLRRLLEKNRFDILTIYRRGGIFSVLGCLVYQVPHQIFGKYADLGNRLLRLAYVCSVVLVTPIPWLLSLLDFLDRSRSFTVGYSVLCKKING